MKKSEIDKLMILFEYEIKKLYKNNNSNSKSKLFALEDARKSLKLLIGYLKYHDEAIVKKVTPLMRDKHFGWTLEFTVNDKTFQKEFIGGK